MKYFLDNSFYKHFNEKNLIKLNNAKIAIIGLGGIGCPLTFNI